MHIGIWFIQIITFSIYFSWIWMAANNPVNTPSSAESHENNMQVSWNLQHVVPEGIITPSDFTCSMCSPDRNTLIDEGQLGRGYVLAFVQLKPCGHYYCKLHFEKILCASGQRRMRVFTVFNLILFYYVSIFCSKLFLAS